MPKTFNILRNSKKSVDRVDIDTSVGFNINQTASILNDSTVKSTIDLNNQYLKERNACDNYRLILTIKPYCTNVLFNACTEVVMGEGSDEVDVVKLNDDIDQQTLSRIKNQIKGKDSDIGIYDMIRNTEYSREGIGFDYHPGLDIFNNHIIRNKSYRIVNDYNNLSNEAKQKFNTIEDTMRSADGTVLKRCCRKTVTDTSMVEKHLYDKDDIMPFYTGEAVSENLKEQDGWFGFYNTSVIPAKSRGGKDMDISRVMNNKGNCEFIDMYPDRTLYSFVPKYNPYRNRLEHNWEYTITYPFENTMTYRKKVGDEIQDKDFVLVKDGEVNALATITVRFRTLPNGLGAIFFRSATKHNLQPDDKICLYFNEDEKNGTWKKSRFEYDVAGVGDINHNNPEYYFYITNQDLLEEIFCTPYAEGYTAWDYVRDYFYQEWSNDLIPEFSQDNTYVPGQLTNYQGKVYITADTHTGTWDSGRFDLFADTDGIIKDEFITEYPDQTEEDGGLTNIPTDTDKYIKVKNAQEPEPTYYVLYNHDRGIAYDGSVDSNTFIQAIINNAFTNNDEYNTNTEVNGSMNGLWSDYISVRFAKTNGNTQCSYYVRKFKQVPGSSGVTMDKETYQLAFSNTIYGDSITQSVFTDNINVGNLKDNLGRSLSEVYLTIVKTNKGHDKWYALNGEDTSGDQNLYNDPDIEYSHCFGSVTCGFELSQERTDTDNIRDIRSDFCDVTLINPSATIQTIGNCEEEDGFTTKDINITNDWFYGDIVEFCPWTCEETTISDVCFRFNTAQREMDENGEVAFKFDEITSDDYDGRGFGVCTYKVNGVVYRPEGYYHKAHYRIPLRDLTPVIQDSHPYISVIDATPIQIDELNGIYILVRTGLKHNLSADAKVLLTDINPASPVEWWLNVVYIPDEYSFVMEKISSDDSNYRDWITICQNLNNRLYTLRGQNMNIPSGATRVGLNTYLWRDVMDIMDINSNESQIASYVFANNAVYVDTCFNFYLKRQDPYNVNGLYFDGSACTIQASNDGTDSSNQAVCSNLNSIDKWFLGDPQSKASKTESSLEYKETDRNSQC